MHINADKFVTDGDAITFAGDAGARLGCCTISKPRDLRSCTTTKTAYCSLMGNASGNIKIVESDCTNGQTEVHFKGTIDCPSCGNTDHGFHVHASGALYDGDENFSCSATGSHFSDGDDGSTANASLHHGAPWDANRHYGDLGNVELCSATKKISVDIVDRVLSLDSSRDGYMLGRGMVLHAKSDDLGTSNPANPVR